MNYPWRLLYHSEHLMRGLVLPIHGYNGWYDKNDNCVSSGSYEQMSITENKRFEISHKGKKVVLWC